jgi:hypothetical protein
MSYGMSRRIDCWVVSSVSKDRKIKALLKVKFALEKTMKAQRGSRGFFNLGATWERLLKATLRPLFSRGRDPLSLVEEDGYARWPVCRGAKNLTPTSIRSRDRPIRSKSLCCLRYPGSLWSAILPSRSGSGNLCLLVPEDGKNTILRIFYNNTAARTSYLAR